MPQLRLWRYEASRITALMPTELGGRSMSARQRYWPPGPEVLTGKTLEADLFTHALCDSCGEIAVVDQASLTCANYASRAG